MSFAPLRFRAGGTLTDAYFYVERNADIALPAALLRGELCYVLTPRQMGKSSLRHRTALRLSERHGVRCASVDLMRICSNTITVADWYLGLVDEIARQLGDENLRTAAESFWRAHDELPIVKRFSRFVSELVLSRIPGPIAFFLDEIDAVQALPFRSDDFFAALSALYDARSGSSKHGRLSTCLLGVAQPVDLIHANEKKRTPFSFGTRIKLEDFARPQLDSLKDGLLPTGGEPVALLDSIFEWTHGHPYMVQHLCEALIQQSVAASAIPRGQEARLIESLVDHLFLQSTTMRNSPLAYAGKIFQRNDGNPSTAEMLALYANVLRGNSVLPNDRDPVQGALILSGMVAVRGVPGQQKLDVRNRVFAKIFDEAWVDARQAERNGVEPVAR